MTHKNFLQALLLLLSVSIIVHDAPLQAAAKRKSRGGARKRTSRGGGGARKSGKKGGGGGGGGGGAPSVTVSATPAPVVVTPVTPTSSTKTSDDLDSLMVVDDNIFDVTIAPEVPPLDATKKPTENLDSSELAPLPPSLVSKTAADQKYIEELQKLSEIDLFLRLVEQAEKLLVASSAASEIIYVTSGDRKVNRVVAQLRCLKNISAGACKPLGCDNRLLCLAAMVSTLRNALIPIVRELPRTVLVLSAYIDKVNKEQTTVSMYQKSFAPIFNILSQALQVLRVSAAILRALGRYQAKVLPSKPTTPAPEPATPPTPTPAPVPVPIPVPAPKLAAPTVQPTPPPLPPLIAPAPPVVEPKPKAPQPVPPPLPPRRTPPTETNVPPAPPLPSASQQSPTPAAGVTAADLDASRKKLKPISERPVGLARNQPSVPEQMQAEMDKKRAEAPPLPPRRTPPPVPPRLNPSTETNIPPVPPLPSASQQSPTRAEVVTPADLKAGKEKLKPISERPVGLARNPPSVEEQMRAEMDKRRAALGGNDKEPNQTSNDGDWN